jgi:hypothetical protein
MGTVSVIFNANPVFPIHVVHEICARVSPKSFDSPESNEIPDKETGVLFAPTKVTFPWKFPSQILVISIHSSVPSKYTSERINLGIGSEITCSTVPESVVPLPSELPDIQILSANIYHTPELVYHTMSIHVVVCPSPISNNTERGENPSTISSPLNDPLEISITSSGRDGGAVIS